MCGISDDLGDFTFEMAPDSIVESGDYWVHVSPQLDIDDDPMWYWELETASTASPALVRDFADFWYPGCLTWSPLDDCTAISAPYQPSLRFELRGVVGGVDCP